MQGIPIPLADVVVAVSALLVLVNLALLTVYLIQRVAGGSSTEELRKCREEVLALRREVSEKESSIRQHYEQLLRDSAIRNSMMVGLWNAYRSGELSRCYRLGGEVRILVDGVVVCEKGEESYAVKAGGPADK